MMEIRLEAGGRLSLRRGGAVASGVGSAQAGGAAAAPGRGTESKGVSRAMRIESKPPRAPALRRSVVAAWGIAARRGTPPAYRLHFGAYKGLTLAKLVSASRTSKGGARALSVSMRRVTS